MFVQRYQWLRGWALRLAGNITDADDLLHDAFLQFVLRRKDLSEIDNVDAYLYGMLRRLRLSNRRKALRAREDSLTVVDYDTAELSLRAADPRDVLRVRDELHHVCEYACRRKHASKSGSVLLLRFFHGFFPGEIASILRCPLRGANDWLRLARREARAYLTDPNQARLHIPSTSNGHDDELSDPLDGLREMIWKTRSDDCVSAETLARTYGNDADHSPSCRSLSHIVSCRDCLARVTALLGMRGPSDRDPHDMLRQDTSWRAARAASSGLPLPSQLRRWQDTLRTVREHVPRELRVAANGIPLGACSVNGEECAFTLSVNIDEPLDFIEVFSEQDVRLLLWEVVPAPEGDVDQSEQIELASHRSLALAMHFDRQWPALEIVYRDPDWSPECAKDAIQTPVLAFVKSEDQAPAPTLWRRLRELLTGPGTRLPLRPVMSALVLAAALMLWMRAPWSSASLSAEQLLADARTIEARATLTPDLVVHRVLQLEERRLPDRAVLSRRRIEGWRSAKRQIAARRVYDERGTLVSAELVRIDGTRTVYEMDRRPHVGARAMSRATMWQWEPSVADFDQLLGRAEATVRDQGDRYVLTYRPSIAADRDGLVEATLVMAKDPVRPIAQTLIVRERGESREFHFSETARTELPEATVPGSLFQPEPALLAPAIESRAPALPLSTTPTKRPTIDPREVDRVEVDLLFALHRLESCLRTPALIASAGTGTLAVTAAPSSEVCAARVRRLVGDRSRDDGRVVLTMASPEVAMSGAPAMSRSAIEDIPAYRTLIGRFAAAGLGSAATTGEDQAVIAAQAFGAWMLEHSRRALEEVRHLDRLSTRWTLDSLAQLDADRQVQLQDVLRDHARRYRRETEALRLQLASVAPTANGGDLGSHDAFDHPLAVQDVRPIVLQLLTMATAHHDAVRQLFDPALNAPRVPVDAAALRAGLRESEVQAAWFDEPWVTPASYPASASSRPRTTYR